MSGEIEKLQKNNEQHRYEERRSSPRHRVEVPIKWYLAEERPIDVREGMLVDLSVVGAAFRTSENLRMNTLVSLKLPPKKLEQVVSNATDTESGVESNDTPQSASRSLSVAGIIVNSHQLEDGNWRYGLKFDRMYYTLAQWLG